MKKTFAVAAAVLSATGPIAMAPQVAAHDGATGIVETRMHAMKTMGKAVRSLKGMIETGESYDANKVREQAKIIRMHAGKAMTKQFPEGSLDEPTHAKPEIWSDWDRFAQLADQLNTYAEGLALAAGNEPTMGGTMMEGQGPMASMMTSGLHDAAELGQMPPDGVFAMMVDTCRSCHMDFRSRKD
ncbi:cytochrome c [uncultured Cohaesibacter sp.]|uniref:c-type cytochrome n=1 Tax=uncultured Cohaesibacter sp. TaxID=1002546 RepID=UPI0029C91082|nr:cytochrome c [uncultured Cohaesibacter sp.]